MVDKTTDNKLRIIGLYRTDYLAQHYVREMAALLKKSHVTLLPHLKSLEKDRILLSKSAGRNKIYSLNFDNLLSKNHLLLSEIIATVAYLEKFFVIKKITSEIFNLHLSGTVLLFGSYAKGTFEKDSDIDILYIGQISESEIGEIRKIGQIYGRMISVKKTTLQNFESGLRKKDSLIIEAVKNHLLLQNPEEFVNALWRYYYEIR